MRYRDLFKNMFAIDMENKSTNESSNYTNKYTFVNIKVSTWNPNRNSLHPLDII